MLDSILMNNGLIDSAEYPRAAKYSCDCRAEDLEYSY